MIKVGCSLIVLKSIQSESIQTCVTSPPYWGLRDYGQEGQLGLEETPGQYIDKLVLVFKEVRRALKDDGTLWLNLGDSYSGSGKGAYADGKVRLTDKSSKQNTSKGTCEGTFTKQKISLPPKNLVGIPWRVALALQADGWYLRQDIIWAKPNPMPESVRDRCTKSHEYIFLLSKSPKYYFDNNAIREPYVTSNYGKSRDRGITPLTAMKKDRSNSGGYQKTHDGKNKRSVWTVTTKPFKGAHFATFPKDLITPCILAGSKKGDVVLDPFAGAGTTGLVCKELDRDFIGIEINPQYAEMAEKRIEAM